MNYSTRERGVVYPSILIYWSTKIMNYSTRERVVVYPCILLLVHQDHELLHQGEGGGLPLYTVTSPPRS
jgi:hypothetical protein